MTNDDERDLATAALPLTKTSNTRSFDAIIESRSGSFLEQLLLLDTIACGLEVDPTTGRIAPQEQRRRASAAAADMREAIAQVVEKRIAAGGGPTT